MAQLLLVHLKGNTYFIPAPTNIGVYVEDNQAILIDSGNDKEAGRQILRLIDQRGWELKLIVNTHSNADHIGGNAFLHEKTGCAIAATAGEAPFINFPLLESAFLYGGFPHRDLRNKFLMAKPAPVTNIISSAGTILDTGLEAIPLPGHFWEMIGVKTPDNICFIADSVFAENIVRKYHMFFLFDVRAHLATIEKLTALPADLFVPAHGEPVSRIGPLVAINKAKITEIIAQLLLSCAEAATTDEVLEKICKHYAISLNPNQSVLLSSTIRSYLAYLFEEGLLECEYADYKIGWKRKREIG